jgi:hypothetical protein
MSKLIAHDTKAMYFSLGPAARKKENSLWKPESAYNVRVDGREYRLLERIAHDPQDGQDWFYIRSQQIQHNAHWLGGDSSLGLGYRYLKPVTIGVKNKSLKYSRKIKERVPMYYDPTKPLFRTSKSVGFFYTEDKPLASLLHLVVIPRKIGPDVHSVRDLKKEHEGVLNEIKQDALKYIDEYKEQFLSLLKGPHDSKETDDAASGFDTAMIATAELIDQCGTTNLKRTGDNRDLLRNFFHPDNIRFGFHQSPTVGYLHMHVLVGMTTEHGATNTARDNWVPLDAVLDIFRKRRTLRSDEYSIEIPRPIPVFTGDSHVRATSQEILNKKTRWWLSWIA